MTLRTLIACLAAIVFSLSPVHAQEELSLTEFLGYVKAFHPLVKQANIALSESEAKLLKARGAFDPKLVANFDEKNLKGSNYYEKLGATFSIPTYYGVTLKGQFSEAEGALLDPENIVNGDQLYGIGASVNLAKGLFANERMTALKQAKTFVLQAREENLLAVNEVLLEATVAFLEWQRAYKEFEIYREFVQNASFRFEGVKDRFIQGDLAAIDTTEAQIAYQSRILGREKAALKLIEKSLKASNYLWIEERPVEINSEVVPILNSEEFEQSFATQDMPLENHPKLRSLGYKVDVQRFERRLQRSNLLPELSVDYQWLSETDWRNNLNFALDPDNSSVKIKLAMPLFQRKERADLKLANLKLESASIEAQRMYISIKNKVQSLKSAAESFSTQSQLAQAMQSNYQQLYQGELDKFDAGESSLFLVNSRESKLIEAKIKAIELDLEQKRSRAAYYFELNYAPLGD